MITHIQGRLVEKNPTDVVVEASGIGYLLNISLHTYSKIPDSENVKLFTHLQVREDAHTLFGFVEKIHSYVVILFLIIETRYHNCPACKYIFEASRKKKISNRLEKRIIFRYILTILDPSLNCSLCEVKSPQWRSVS